MWSSSLPLALGVLALVCVAPRSAGADEPHEAQGVGDTHQALPGIVNVPIVGMPVPRLAVAADVGYGFTESQADEGSHHRVAGQLGLGAAPVHWLEVGLGASLRHDVHPADDMGKDSGTTTGVTVLTRVGGEVSSGLRLGADVTAQFPGAEEVVDTFKSPALEARLLTGWSHAAGLHVAGFAGYRLDRSEGVASERDRYRLGDRLALGASEFDAVLAGLGLRLPLGATELLAEVSGDILLGADAPSVTQSPLRAHLGARFPLTKALSMQVLSTASLSSRPELDPDSLLIPVEPRFGISFGLRYRFVDGPEPLPPAPPAPKPPPPKAEPVKPPPQPVPEDVPPKAPATQTVKVVVVDGETQHPLSDATVEIIIDGQARELKFVSGSTFELQDVPVGPAEVLVRAERLKDWREPVTITADEPLDLTVEMTHSANSGQIRGLIRGFDGAGLKALVRIEPGNRSVESDEDGSFRIDLPPGDYQVEVTLEGYRSQRMQAKVGKDGVVVLNVDLIKRNR